MRSLCVSAGWMYKLSVVYNFFNGQLIIHMILHFVCKVIRWVFLTFDIPFCCVHVTNRSYAIYTSVSRCGITSFFETLLNLTISFVYMFSRGFKQRITSELDGYFRNSVFFVLTALKVVHWRNLISLHDMQMVHLQIFKD